MEALHGKGSTCCVNCGRTSHSIKPLIQFHLCLRTEGFSVIECAQTLSRQTEASLAVNHSSVAVVAVAGVRLTSINIGVKPSTFECIAMCVTAGTSSYIVLLVYRTGSAAITVSFFAELSDVLDRLSTYVDPFVLAVRPQYPA